MVSVTLDQVRARSGAHGYPVGVLEGCETALVLFAAGFHGANDGIHIADAGIVATCVDIQSDRLHEMEAAYPSSWEFVVGDVFDYAAAADGRWDVVSVDCPTGLFGRCAETIDVWCSLARRAVILGTGHDTGLEVPEGWTVTGRVHRSDFSPGGVFWAVLELA